MIRFRSISAVAILSLGLCTPAVADTATPVLEGITVDFDLLDRNGDAARYEIFRGKNLLLAFGFTHCAHICPMIAANMARVLKGTDKEATGVFISVDTERDSPAITDDYAKGFSDQLIGLSGTYQQIAEVARNFNVTFVVTKSEDNYVVQHTPSIFLIGPDGKVIDVFAMNASSSAIADAMK